MMTTTVGGRIRKIRQERGLTQEALAAPEFTKSYVSALERGAVRPSLKALEVLARRLDVPVVQFLSASPQINNEPDIQAVQEDIIYQCNYAKMLMRAGQLMEAVQLVDEIEKNMLPYEKALAPRVVYLIPFLRGRAHVQQMEPRLARSELERAIEIIGADEEASAHVRNLLGVVFFELDLPQLALDEHLCCLEIIRAGAVKDPNFRVSVYRNLANDYWSLNDPTRAIAIYREALPILEDLNDMTQQARVFWGMSMAYAASNDWSAAKLYGLRALHILEAADNRAEAASICLNLAETLASEERYEEAQQLLDRAENFLQGTGNRTVLSYLYRSRADLSRRQGMYEKASQYVKESVALAGAIYEASRRRDQEPSDELLQNPIRPYVQALQMEALVEESGGHKQLADQLFQKVLALLEQEGFEETRYDINFSYAEVLSARGDFEKAVKYYRAASQFRPPPARRGN